MKKVEVDFISCESCVPCVEFKLPNGKSFSAIIDSGSDSSLLDKDIAKENKDCINIECTDKIIEFAGLYSKDKKALITGKTCIMFNNDVYTSKDISFAVADLEVVGVSFNEAYGIKPVAIIGSDFLKEHKVKIDYRNQKLML